MFWFISQFHVEGGFAFGGHSHVIGLHRGSLHATFKFSFDLIVEHFKPLNRSCIACWSVLSIFDELHLKYRSAEDACITRDLQWNSIFLELVCFTVWRDVSVLIVGCASSTHEPFVTLPLFLFGFDNTVVCYIPLSVNKISFNGHFGGKHI